MSYSRLNNEKEVNRFYRRKFRWIDRCIYCGDPATTLDHVFPVASAVSLDLARPNVRRELKQGLNLVPSCNSCNVLAGNKVFKLIREKRHFIHERLRQKFNRILSAPDWTLEQIAELKHTLRSSVVKMQMDKRKIEIRVQWPKPVQKASLQELALALLTVKGSRKTRR